MALSLLSDAVVEIELEDVLVDEKMGMLTVTPFKHTVRLTGLKNEIAAQIDQKIAEIEVSLKKLHESQTRGASEKTQLMIGHLEKTIAQYRQAKNDLD
jgi:hypothetical protein